MAYKLTPYDRRVQAELIRQEREARFAARYPTYKRTGAAKVAPVDDEKKGNGFVKALHTAGDVGANVGIGLGKGLEGIVDLFAGIGGGENTIEIRPPLRSNDNGVFFINSYFIVSICIPDAMFDIRLMRFAGNNPLSKNE